MLIICCININLFQLKKKINKKKIKIKKKKLCLLAKQ